MIPLGQPGDKPCGTAPPRAGAARSNRRRSPAAGSASTSRPARCGDWSARTGAGLGRYGATPPEMPAGWPGRRPRRARPHTPAGSAHRHRRRRARVRHTAKRTTGSAGMICTGSSNWSQKWATRCGCRCTTVCTASRSRCGSSGPVNVKSSCTAYRSPVAVVGGAGVEEQALLQRGQRQHVGDSVLLAQLVDLLLVEPGGREIRRSQPAPAAAHMGADPGQRLEPQPAQPVDLSRDPEPRAPTSSWPASAGRPRCRGWRR